MATYLHLVMYANSVATLRRWLGTKVALREARAMTAWGGSERQGNLPHVNPKLLSETCKLGPP